MRKKFLKSLVFALSIALFASCATVTKGKYQEITVESNVPGAIVELDGVELGYTPFRGKIKKGKEGRIKVSKPGYYVGYVDVIRKRNNKAFASGNTGNTGLGFAFASPFFLVGLNEEYIQYPKKEKEYKKELEEYEKMIEEKLDRGETISSDSPPERPQNYAPLYFLTGATAAMGAFGALASVDMSTEAAWEYRPSSYYVQLKEGEQSASDFSNELFIRYFATMNHSQIAIDVGNNGEYSKALVNLMETKMNYEAARRAINEALEESKGNQVMFGDALIERFRR